ncbi:Uncharacterized protein APZ42_034227 [Daphnia magna]|uniref:RNA-directed DNA polymerase n=1 Tax=Daphnia magna TaxID=35525 RepID=A0A164KBF0_9CRUS|nr:Uncharacterized protein APZ42_034227 [Daphnia magna]
MKGLPPPKEEAGTELRDLVLELKAEIAELKRGGEGPRPEKCGPKEDGKGGQRSDRRDEGENRWRNDRRKEDGKAWQARRRDSEEDDRNTVGMVSADEDDSGEAAVLLIDISRLITEEVVCRAIRIKAVIDTGAVMSVASPSLQEKLGNRRTGWDGPSAVMVNGQRAPLLGVFELEVEHRGMKASGKVILLEMRGIELLLGNDFLSQFKRLQINYVPNGAELLLGELPVNVIEELEAVKAPRMVTKTGRMLPPRAIVPVEIEATTLNEATWMIEPSEHLARAKGVTAGKVLVSSDQPLGQVLMVNLTNRRAYLREGTVLGQTEAVEPSLVAVDEGGTPDSLGDYVKEDSAESISDSYATPRVTSIPRQAFRAQVASTLPPADVEKMVELLEEFDTSFSLKEGELGSPYKSAWKERAIVQKQVDEMLSQSVIERSTSPWASPVVLVKKKDGSWRFCVDYLRLNAISVKDVSRCRGSKRRCLGWGTLASSRRWIWRVAGEVSVKALGQVISGDGVRPDPEKINAVANFPSPSTLCKPSEQLKCVRSFVGLWSYYRRFIPQFPHTANPLTDMFKKGGCFVWEESQEVSFGLMKQALVSAATLAYPDFTKPFEIHPDACDYGLGAVLLQRVNNIESPLAYASRLLSPTVDYVTKWSETRALPSADASEVADFLVKCVLLRHGVPRQLTTDQGRCFTAEANGLVERLNHTLADMLSMYVSSDHKDWDESLPFVTFAYNTSRHESTGRTPFYLVYGREAVLPIDGALNADPYLVPPPERDPSEWAVERLQYVVLCQECKS